MSSKSFSYQLKTGTGLGLMIAMAVTPVFAQTAAPAPQDDVTEVVVVGARAAQQTANDRKKKARTPTDSIVADDVGAFPDRNLNEAISRVAGVALSRNEFGEGDSVSIRGNGPDLTRVEIDGVGVQSAGGSMAINGSEGGGRGADMRELPSDLIKSVDVVKGTTADMTEGSLGGGIQIQTRTGLDFKKPYISMRVGAQQNSLGQRWTPDLNIVASKKFFDNRLGVIFSVTSSEVQNDSHAQETVTSGSQGYARTIDWDNSPNKTFSFNPATATGDGANTPLLSWAAAAGNGALIYSKSPLEVVTLSSQAQSKADCTTLFPTITDAQLGLIAASTNNANRAAAQNQRYLERQTCLNQWNDYHPSLIRSFMTTQTEKRLAADLRFDFRVNDNLTVYAKYAVANREIDEQRRLLALGGVSINTAGKFTDSLVTNTNIATGTAQIRTPVAGSGYYLYNAAPGNIGWTTGAVTLDQVAGSVTQNMAFPIYGQVVNVDPNSVTVDANHHVTQFTITDGTVEKQQTNNSQYSDSTYLTFGAQYKKGPLRVDFLAAHSESEFGKTDQFASFTTPYTGAKLTVQPNGLWLYEMPAGFDINNPANYSAVRAAAANIGAVTASINGPASPAYTVAQQPWTSNSFSFTYSPRLEEGSENTFKLDATYRIWDKVPFFRQLKTGISFRDAERSAWQGGGYTVKPAVGTFGAAGYVAPVVVPTMNLRGTFRACDDAKYGTTGTAAPAGSIGCNYGYVPSTNLSNTLYGVETFTPAQMQEIVNNVFRPASSTFFGSYPDRGNLISGWTDIDVAKLVTYMNGDVNHNLDCLKVCRGSDGNMYEQPVLKSQEKITAAYYVLDFEQELPFGLVFDGNFGVRAVETEVNGSGLMTLTSVRKNASFSAANPYAAAGVTSTSLSKNVTLQKTTRDWLPSYNANLWVIPDKLVLRYSTGKTISRPPIGRLLAAGTCIFDERSAEIDAADGSGLNDCNTRVGNPDLKPYTAKSENWTVEWYPNKDTMFSLAALELDVKIGAPQATTLSNYKLFEGTDVTDPVTGQPVSDLSFDVATWRNGDPYNRKGWEFATKTAFTFLPWYLRYTGADFNYSKLESSSNTIRDPNSGDSMHPKGESDYFANLSLWYDDGKTNARISYQGRGESFACISSCGANTVNNYPGPFDLDARPLPYNPGQAYFRYETQYIDAKISHKVNTNVEVYLEGRNLTYEAPVTGGGQYNAFTSAENTWRIGYGGRRVMFGVTYRMQ
ncbi:TonB-dependent receptor [Asticcacaulis sp. YBE204]|uniref:TonB-dependent receptor n=1 Tax=Asticcacaulis sp. YBE204 TaxID=1282363 RepID=UPI0003C3CB83|nr:TonB-dependent receptor [Asticcacaulis sp. YBE204]ESQ79245.1 hypothetical protein AEYBE204_09555 [Asticcacaulis sp. YBE204]